MNGGRSVQIVVLSVGLTVLVAGFGALLPTGGIGPRFSETMERSFPAEATKEIVVRSFNGRVDYEPWDGDEVSVKAVRRVGALTRALAERFAAAAEVQMEQEAGRLTVTAERPGGWFFWGNVSVTVLVRVPRGWAGDVTLATSNGAIAAEGVKGAATLRTSNGTVTVRDHEGRLEVRTSNGRIDILGHEGVLEAVTSNGAVRIADAVLAGIGLVRTSNGSVDLTARLTKDAGYDVNSSNGSIHVTLSEPDVTVDLRTSNGRIDLQAELLASRIDRTHVQGRIGDGSARLNVRTSNGSVTLRAAP